MIFDYETLRVIWWVLLGVLLIGFAIMDGFDLGVAMLLPVIGRTDMEKRIMINAIGPTWEGNQVWFILGGGAIFAAWPALYALSFSGFYLAMFVVLMALILRPVGFKYRSKIDNDTWRKSWDIALFIGGFVPSLIFGVAIGNVIQGVPFNFDNTLRVFYTGTFLGLLNPFALLCGLASVSMLAMHGSAFAALKTEGALQSKAKTALKIFSLLTVILFIAGGVWCYFGIDGYVLSAPMSHVGPSNPLHKQVGMEAHAWFNNFQTYSWMLIAPSLAIFMAIMAILLVKHSGIAFICTALSTFGIVSTVGLSMFPFILPSSTNPEHSLMVWDSSSSQITLFIMLIAVVIFLPIILAYTAWVYRVLRGKINAEHILNQHDSAY